MEKDQNYMSEKILNLTLEIINLLTGESSCIIVYPPHSLNFKKHKMQKILEVIKKMTELLTGEVPIRCQDVTVYFSMEEWEYLEGHKDLYKDVMMEDQPPLKSLDGSSNRNPPERCPHPLYSQDSTQEGHTIPQHDQGGEALIDIKVKDEEDEDNGGQGSTKQVGMMMKRLVEEDTPREISTEHRIKTSEEDLAVYTDYQLNDHSQEILTIPKINPEFPSEERQSNCSSLRAPHTVERPADHSSLWETTQTNQKTRSCPRCFVVFENKDFLIEHKESQKCKKRFLCSKCGKSFPRRAKLLKHQHSHLKENICLVCGKCFLDKLERIAHQKSHKAERRFSCSDCEKGFMSKADLVRHQRIHTGEKPYSCSVCGKSYSQKSVLTAHQRNHTGEKPYKCEECGKCFVRRTLLVNHQKTHTGEKPYHCSLCDKGFSQMSSFNYHMGCHSKKNPLVCSVCGKCFLLKTTLRKHLKAHAESESTTIHE